MVDDERRERAEAVLDAMLVTISESEETIFELRERVARVDRNYSATAEDYRKISRQLDETWNERAERMVDHLYELRQHVTREEWGPLVAAVAATVAERDAELEN